MTKQATTQQASILTTFSPEQLAALSPEQIAALAGISVTASLETPEAEAPKAPKAPKAKAPKVNGGDWVTFIDMNGQQQMCKAKATAAGVYLKGTHISDAQNVTKHANQGKALQALNEMRKAPEAPKPEAKPDQQPEAAPEAPADLDERAERIAKKNAAIIATIPLDDNGSDSRRRAVRNKLTQLHKAGYPYARLATNKHHQLDGLHIYPGQKGHGRDEAFKACTTKQAQAYRAKVDKARADGKPAPKPLPRVFVWSPVGGGNLYARGIFGEVAEA